jgi:alpha-glucosidase (family GH31 glycosyl hydrolase)
VSKTNHSSVCIYVFCIVIRYGDIDYFRERLDFTWDPVNFNGLPEYIDWLHANGMKFITILDPAIDSEEPNYDVFTEGQKADVWIKWPARRNIQFNETGNRNMLGYVWPNGIVLFKSKKLSFIFERFF